MPLIFLSFTVKGTDGSSLQTDMAKAEAATAIVLTLLCAGTAANVGRDGRVQPVRISSNSDFSVFDCDFKVSDMFGVAILMKYPLCNRVKCIPIFHLVVLQPGENCLWTWEEDNVTDGRFVEGATPGQHGFYRMNGDQVKALTKKSNGKFVGPQYDRFGTDEGK